MTVNMNRISNRTRMCFAGGSVALAALMLSIIAISHAYADRGDGGTAGGADTIAEVRALLTAWGNQLNTPPAPLPPPAHALQMHADAMAAMYGDTATLLPTVKPKVWRTNAPVGSNLRIVDYFRDQFLASRPKLCGVSDQDTIIMGRYATNQGLYTFELGPVGGRYKVLARFTYVYKKNDDQLGFTPANTRIIQHHSSMEPKRKCGGDDATGDKGDIDGNGWVNVDDLLKIINSWGPCPNPAPLCP